MLGETCNGSEGHVRGQHGSGWYCSVTQTSLWEGGFRSYRRVNGSVNGNVGWPLPGG